jgi:hypothetical protein
MINGCQVPWTHFNSQVLSNCLLAQRNKYEVACLQTGLRSANIYLIDSYSRIKIHEMRSLTIIINLSMLAT